MPPTRRFGARPRPAQAGGRRGTYALPERQKVATSGVAPHGAPCFAADHSGHVKTWLVYAMPPWRSIMRSGSVGRGTRLRQSRETRRRALLSRRTAFGAHGQVVQHQVFRRRGRHGAGSGAFWHQSAGPRHVRRHEGVCTLAYRVVCVAVCACQRGTSRAAPAQRSSSARASGGSVQRGARPRRDDAAAAARAMAPRAAQDAAEQPPGGRRRAMGRGCWDALRRTLFLYDACKRIEISRSHTGSSAVSGAQGATPATRMPPRGGCALRATSP